MVNKISMATNEHSPGEYYDVQENPIMIRGTEIKL
jgi:hypothetical protein